MSDRIVNAQGQVVWDGAGDKARELAAREAREGESFTAMTDCPKCGAVDVHWLAEPRFQLSPGSSPQERALGMINDSIHAIAICAGGAPSRRYDPTGTVVARVCSKCGYRWGQR